MPRQISASSRCELRQEGCQLLRGARTVEELDERLRPLEANVPAQLVVVCELERLRVQVDERGLRPAAARRLGGGKQVRNRLSTLPRLAPVVGEDSRERVCNKRVFDVTRDRRVSLATGGPGHRRVRDLADQHVLERVLNVTHELGRRIAANEIASFEHVQRFVDVVGAADGREDAAPERLSDDRCSEKRVPRARRDRVDARGNRLAHRHRQVLICSGLGDGRGELLEKQRVAASDVYEPHRIERRRQVLRERSGCDGVEGLERDRRLRCEATAPGRMQIEQLRPCSGDEQHGRVADVLGKVVQERELARIRPVNVLEDEHRRLHVADAFDEAPCREEEQLTLRHIVVDTQPEQERQVAEGVGRFVIRYQLDDCGLELRTCDVRRIGLEDPGRLVHDAGERLIAGLLLVGQTATAEDAAAALRDERRHFVAET